MRIETIHEANSLMSLIEYEKSNLKSIETILEYVKRRKELGEGLRDRLRANLYSSGNVNMIPDEVSEKYFVSYLKLVIRHLNSEIKNLENKLQNLKD